MILTYKMALDYTIAENSRIDENNKAKIARRLNCVEEKQFADAATLGMLLMWRNNGGGIPVEVCLLIVSYIQPSRTDAVKFSKVCKQAFLFGDNAKKEHIKNHGKNYEELQEYVINPMVGLLI